MPTTKDALTGDPLVSFNFSVNFEGHLSGYFTSVSGISAKVDVTEHKIVGQGDREAVRKVPGRTNVGEVTLVRGLTANMDAYQWRQMVEQGKVGDARTNGSVIMYDQAGTPIAQWDFEAVWPSKIDYDGFYSSSSGIINETITLVYESMIRTM